MDRHFFEVVLLVGATLKVVSWRGMDAKPFVECSLEGITITGFVERNDFQRCLVGRHVFQTSGWNLLEGIRLLFKIGEPLT